MQLAALALISAFFSGAAGAQDPCARVGVYERGAKAVEPVRAVDFLKECEDAVKAMTAIQQSVQASRRGVRFDSGGPAAGGGQADQLGQAAASARAGATAQAQHEQITRAGQARFARVTEHLNGMMERLEREARGIAARPGATPDVRSRVAVLARNAKADFEQLRDLAEEISRGLERTVIHHQASGQQLDANSALAEENARRLREANSLRNTQAPAAPAAGISNDTMVTLGGVALITAGAVGGIYWVGSKMIRQGENAADRTIAKVEESAKRIIEFAASSASNVIANVEAAANRIYDKAKSDVEGLINNLKTEVAAQFAFLTDAGLLKLKEELNSMFTSLINRARNEGNQALADSLTRTWNSLRDMIDGERRRRGGNTPTITATSTSTGGSTATQTGTATTTGTYTRQ